jgi:hypothetical protein
MLRNVTKGPELGEIFWKGLRDLIVSEWDFGLQHYVM